MQKDVFDDIFDTTDDDQTDKDDVPVIPTPSDFQVASLIFHISFFNMLWNLNPSNALLDILVY